MNFGKQHIYDLHINDIIYLGVLAQQLQQEAKERGERQQRNGADEPC